MKFTTDSYLEIGTSHNICEDYVYHGIIDNKIPYIIVCDGCSSSPGADFGARIMAHSCRVALGEVYVNGGMEILDDVRLRASIEKKITYNVSGSLKLFNLTSKVCDATLLYAFILDEQLFYTVIGDGNVIIRRTDDSIYWENYSYESGAPFYLSYQLDYVREENYLKEYGNKIFKIDTLEGKPNDVKFFNSETMPPSTKSQNNSFEINLIKSITLSSDGINTYDFSYKRRCQKPEPTFKELVEINPNNMIQRITAYKNFTGEFVKRRMKRIKQECEKVQAEHFDDISCATIHIEH
jgi:hypothetical protein